uniref:Retroviral polymerase SH3-like domain-containing protein n=1 Tax=Tanacetum cinerariifolium TaxID=118510 RepID=A0A699I7S9_TANCI|nr:hypothetical protein [Tanacetum cinerariifolium]
MVRSMMNQTTIPKSCWDYALESAARILNMVPTKKGCEALVKRDTLTKPEKLKCRSIKCIFVIYPKETMGYSFYYPPENKVFVAQNVEFLKNSLIAQKASESLEDLEIIQEKDTHPSIDTSLNHEKDDQEIDEPQSDINPIRRSTRTRHLTDRLCLYTDAEEHGLRDLGEPANYKGTLLDLESDKWLNALNVEMQSIKDNERMKNVPYASAIGSIMYAVRCTRSDVAFSQNITSRFQQNPGDTKRELMVSCYTDAGYLTDADDMNSQTGYVFVLNGEAVWNRKFISRLGVVLTIEEPINMYCDNTGAIAIAKDHEVTKGARHFRAKVHYLQETIEMGDVKIEKVDIDDNIADPFTKALAFPKHSELTKKIGMIPASSLM